VGEFEGIAQEVQDDLLDLLAIARDRLEIFRQIHVHGELRPQNDRLQLGADFANQFGDPEGGDLQRHAPGLDPGDVENLVDDREEVTAVRFDAAQMAADRRIEIPRDPWRSIDV